MPPRLYLYHKLVAEFRSELPRVPIAHLRTLCLLVVGVSLARHVALNRIAQSLLLPVHPLSTERRFRRWFGNTRVETEPIWDAIRARLLAGPGSYRFVLDLTPMNADWQIVCLGVVRGHRVLPLAVRCVPLRTPWDEPLRIVWAAMVTTVAAQVPDGSQITVLLDRGLVGPGIITPCTNAGWAVVARLRHTGSGRMRLVDGQEVEVSDWIAQHPKRWSGAVRLFKHAGWIDGWLTIWHDPTQREAWVLFSTSPGGIARVRDYRKRMRIEASFQDLKRRGFQLSASGLREPSRIERLWLVVTLALWWLHSIGERIVKDGHRARIDRPGKRNMSWLKLGWCQIEHWLATDDHTSLLLPFGSSIIRPKRNAS